MTKQTNGKKLKNLDNILKQRADANKISCSNMVVAFFGDVVSVHGGWIWLGSLIEALKPMGYSERLIRTAVYRLMQNDWLKSRQTGRRSYYCISESAWGFYEKAARRIYADAPPNWDGGWTLVVPSQVPEQKREEFRKSLLWQGFNTLVNGMYAHPSSDTTSLDETLYEQKLLGDVVVLSAKTADVQSQDAIKKLVKDRWNLGELEEAYSAYIEFYRPLSAADVLSKLSAREQFLLRLLLVHEFRRILLRDPDFPDQMLPQGWIGREVQQLVKRTYKALTAGSVRYICAHLENAQGHIPAPSEDFYKRFGGLPKK